MATEVRFRRGTTAEHSTFTGAGAEMTVDTTKNTLVVHDGSSPGGTPLATEANLAVAESDIANLQGEVASLQIRPRKNLLINGNFDIWQRGTSVSVGYPPPPGPYPQPGDYLTADRWHHLADGFYSGNYNQGVFTPGQTAVPGNPRYYFNVSGNQTTGAAYSNYQQPIEGVHTAAGQTVTFSVWLKGANAENVNLELVQNFGTGGSPSPPVFHTSPGFTLTPVWTRYTYTVTLTSISGKTLGVNNNDSLSVNISMPTGVLYNVDIAQAQVEIGDTATDFETRSVAEELALCERYYERGRLVWQGMTTNSFLYATGINFRTEKRASPTMEFTSLGEGGFVTTSTLIGTDGRYFEMRRQANTTAPDSFYVDDWTAEAEL